MSKTMGASVTKTDHTGHGHAFQEVTHGADRSTRLNYLTTYKDRPGINKDAGLGCTRGAKRLPGGSSSRRIDDFLYTTDDFICQVLSMNAHRLCGDSFCVNNPISHNLEIGLRCNRSERGQVRPGTIALN